MRNQKCVIGRWQEGHSKFIQLGDVLRDAHSFESTRNEQNIRIIVKLERDAYVMFHCAGTIGSKICGKVSVGRCVMRRYSVEFGNIRIRLTQCQCNECVSGSADKRAGHWSCKECDLRSGDTSLHGVFSGEIILQ